MAIDCQMSCFKSDQISPNILTTQCLTQQLPERKFKMMFFDKIGERNYFLFSLRIRHRFWFESDLTTNPDCHSFESDLKTNPDFFSGLEETGRVEEIDCDTKN